MNSSSLHIGDGFKPRVALLYYRQPLDFQIDLAPLNHPELVLELDRSRAPIIGKVK